jgi:glycosyltransferase involved in cell wall biosynthesis
VLLGAAYYNARSMVVSVVIPVLNEERNVRELHRRLVRVLEGEGADFEIIFVNDGSSDATRHVLRELHEQDERAKSVHLARNFGHQAAISAGLRAASGDAVVAMDGDLQDAPELLPAFLERWRAGYEVVYAVREQRVESWLKRLAYKAFYRTLQRISQVPLPLDSGDFSLMDRRVVNVINEMPERIRFVRGMRSWVGFRQTGVAQARGERFAGEPKYTSWKLLRLALDGFVGFSYRPLQMASVFGAIVSVIALLLSVALVALKIIHGIPLVGWTSLIVTVLFLGGVQLICVGILGEYVGRIYDEVRQRPSYVVADVFGKTRLDVGPPRADRS